MTVNEQRETVAREAEPGTTPAADDKKLVDLVRAALVDPNLHTSTRMKIHRRIVKILTAPDRAAGRRSRPE